MSRECTAPLTRRSLLRRLALAAGMAGALSAKGSGAQSPARLDVNDPQAIAQGYVEDASRVDARKNPTYGPGTNCENCLQLQGKAGDVYRPCTVFPGKLVNVKGWCKAWVAEI